MNRNDLVERLAEEHELTKGFARELIDSIFGIITTAARNGLVLKGLSVRTSDVDGAGLRLYIQLSRPTAAIPINI